MSCLRNLNRLNPHPQAKRWVTLSNPPAYKSTGTADALDAVLDDIESVLESNAEEYVGSFVQKGGE